MKLSDALSGFEPKDRHAPPADYLVGWAEESVPAALLSGPLPSPLAAVADDLGGRAAWLAEARDGKVTFARLVGGLPAGKDGPAHWFDMIPYPFTQRLPPAWTIRAVGVFPLVCDGPVKPSADPALAARYLREVVFTCPACPRYHCGVMVGGLMTPNGVTHAYLLAAGPGGSAVLTVPMAAVRPLSDIPVT